MFLPLTSLTTCSTSRSRNTYLKGCDLTQSIAFMTTESNLVNTHGFRDWEQYSYVVTPDLQPLVDFLTILYKFLSTLLTFLSILVIISVIICSSPHTCRMRSKNINSEKRLRHQTKCGTVYAPVTKYHPANSRHKRAASMLHPPCKRAQLTPPLIQHKQNSLAGCSDEAIRAAKH